MVDNFDFFTATPVLFGVNRLQTLDKELYRLGEGKLLVVADKGVAKAGLVDQLLSVIERANLPYVVFDEFEPNPTIDSVERGAAVARKERCQALVGIGGGSAIDTAKLIAMAMTNDGSIKSYEGANKFPNPALPIIAIPTTAGTGSEVSVSAVVVERERNYKISIRGNSLAPKAAILDPQLIRTLPPEIAAACGMDALTHAIEAHTSLLASPPAQAMALQAISLIAQNLRPFVANRQNTDAASNMLIASMIAGMAFAHARVATVHAMAHPLGGHYDLPHGLANAILLPYVMDFNLIACEDDFAQVARAMGEQVDGMPALDAAQYAVSAVRRLATDIGIPPTLATTAAKEEGIEAMARDAMDSGLTLPNPRSTTMRDVIMLYRRAFAGE